MSIRSRLQKTESARSQNAYGKEVFALQNWFQNHVTLGGKPYTLDLDQTKAVIDEHKNTLVTARAGSGKTRVIVAKIAYLISVQNYKTSEIAAFMFNRTAAAEVNERISDVRVDGRTLLELSGQQGGKIKIASTFHKYALDLLKFLQLRPEIISETEHNDLMVTSADAAIYKLKLKLSPTKYQEYLELADSFVARAGQKYIGADGIRNLRDDIVQICQNSQKDANHAETLRIHQFCFYTYKNYIAHLKFPKVNFNILISYAAELMSAKDADAKFPQVSQLKYLLVDEYQDFSYLFFSMIQAMRKLCPSSKLFVVGDDWQAINRFAGSDVDYFLNFQHYFPDENTNIPLMTNYRSCKQIVENANNYMVANYNPEALRAVAFNREKGFIYHISYQKIKFDTTDIYEDALGDARYQLALISACQENSRLTISSKNQLAKLLPIAQMLKAITKIIRKHPHTPVMLLHRHNFTSVANITLETFFLALQKVIIGQGILSLGEFKNKVRCMTMHKSKGLESDIVIILETNQDVIAGAHPHANLFQIFDDNVDNTTADRHRLLYVALTRAKRKLYILSSDPKSPI